MPAVFSKFENREGQMIQILRHEVWSRMWEFLPIKDLIYYAQTSRTNWILVQDFIRRNTNNEGRCFVKDPNSLQRLLWSMWSIIIWVHQRLTSFWHIWWLKKGIRLYRGQTQTNIMSLMVASGKLSNLSMFKVHMRMSFHWMPNVLLCRRSNSTVLMSAMASLARELFVCTCRPLSIIVFWWTYLRCILIHFRSRSPCKDVWWNTCREVSCSKSILLLICETCTNAPLHLNVLILDAMCLTIPWWHLLFTTAKSTVNFYQIVSAECSKASTTTVGASGGMQLRQCKSCVVQ